MWTRSRFASFATALLLAGLPAAAQQRALPTAAKTWTGDFDRMVERRMVRVLVPYSRTLYFNDKGRERGVTADLVREFEKFINRKYAKTLAHRPITVYMIPTTRDELVQDIVDGGGDIAAGNLTVTEQRLRSVDFVSPERERTTSELVLTGPRSPAIATAEDLSGKTVHTRASSSYYESLVALNVRFKQARKPGVQIVLVPDALEDEDLIEMLAAGLFEAIVVDDWKARIWAKVVPNITVNEQAAVRTGGKRGWAIRKESPRMREILDEFHEKVVMKGNVQHALIAQYGKRARQLQDPTKTEEWRRFENTLALFRKYGERYRFDPLMLAAQGYQESGLDQSKRSRVGAIGIMQLMPATGAELKVGDIRLAEPNIHGGAKYMDQLMGRYFADAKFDAPNRSLFAFAAYNAGPGRIASMRREAAKRGLNPDKWFNNVELVTAEKVGIETTMYVRNIYKYYAAYRMMLDVHEEQRKAREELAPRKG